MTKQEVKKSSDNELITEAIWTYGRLLQNFIARRGTAQLEKHWNDCAGELVKRNLITENDVKWLNM